MAETFAQWPAVDRQAVIEDAAAASGMPPAIIEKDFWCCWLLGRVLVGDLGEHLTFKGGTSLSKGYDLIQRFSEDIDIALDPEVLELGVDLRAKRNTTQQNKLNDQMDERAERVIRERLVPDLATRCEAILGPSGDRWALEVDNQGVHFRYPSAAVSSLGYIQPQVLLEIGPRGAGQPEDHLPIEPYLLSSLPDATVAADACQASVRTLAVRRTFWEKILILFRLAHGLPKRGRPRIARHYYDVVMLSRNLEICAHALAASDLLVAVAEDEARFYPRAWVPIKQARIGSLRLLPREQVGLDFVMDDYEQMAGMFWQDPPTFPTLVAELISLEQRINALPG